VTHNNDPLAAVLFDMDGTLVDTEHLWWQAVEQVATSLGHQLTDADQPEVLGRPVAHTAAHLAAVTGVAPGSLAADLHGAFATRVHAGVVPRPGALWLLDRLRDHGIPTALVSASPRSIVDIVLGVLGPDRFAVTIAADDVTHSKPAPDPYRAAARALGVSPSHCVAIEDTPTGVTSAEAAGCRVVAVPSLAPITGAPGRTVLDSLEQVTVAGLRDLASPRLRVMSWNLWVGGTKVNGYRDKQLAVLRELDVDIVGLQETHHTATRELAEALGWHHHQAGANLGILSRHPIVETLGDPDPGFYGGAGARIRLDSGDEVVLWTAHLNYTPYGPYEACFDRRPVSELLEHETASGRLGQIRDVLHAMAGDLAACHTTPVLLVGDFNVPSHLDWTEPAAPLHGGYGPVAWPVTAAAEAVGLRDSYRVAHPDPVRDPGRTWSPVHHVHEDGSGRAEPQDRIDYVLYASDRLAVLESTAYTSGSPAPFPNVADNDWPSDHAAVITTFALRSPER
jgi:HAD superfamily hydrolase (TIGR01509 family)